MHIDIKFQLCILFCDEINKIMYPIKLNFDNFEFSN